MTRARFVCSHKLNRGDCFNITLEPIINGSVENETFFNSIPSAIISLTALNPEAARQFYEGGSYYVDFTLADQEG